MKRFLLWALGVLALLLVGAALLSWRIDADYVSRIIAEATAKATGQPLIFDEKPSIALLPPGVKFGRLHWGEEKTTAGFSMQIESGMAQLEVLPLLSGQLVIHEIRLHRPVVHLHEAPAAPQETAGTRPHEVRNADEAAAEAPQQAQGQAPSDTIPVELKRLMLSGGSLHYVAADGSQTTLQDINLSLENLRSRAEASLKCDFGLDMKAGPAPKDAGHGKAEAQALPFCGNLALDAKLCYQTPVFSFRQLAVTFTPLASSPLAVHLPAKAGPLQFSATGALDLQQGLLTLAASRLSIPQGRLSFSGKGRLTPLSLEGVAQLEGSPRKLLALAGIQLPPHKKDSLNAKSTLSWQGQKLDLSNMVIQLDDTQAQGGLHLGLCPLELTGELRSGPIRLDNYLPQGSPAGQSGSTGSKEAAQAITQADSAHKGSAEQTAQQNAVQAPLPQLDLSLHLDALSYKQLRLGAPGFHLHGQDGLYRLDGLKLNFNTGGSLEASGRIRYTGRPAQTGYELKASGQQIALGPLLQALELKRSINGTVGFQTSLQARGNSLPALENSLGGSGDLRVDHLQIPALTAALHSLPPLKALPDTFDRAHSPFVVQQGQVTAKPVTVDAAGLNARGRAHISLPGHSLDARVTVQALGMNIPLIVKGPWNGLSYSVDPRFALQLGRGLGQAMGTAGQKTGQSVQQNLPSQNTLQQGVRGAEGLLRGIFK